MTDLSKDELRKAKEKVAKDNFYESWTDLTNHEPDPIIRDCLIDAYDLAITSQRSELLKEKVPELMKLIITAYSDISKEPNEGKKATLVTMLENDILSLLEQPKR